MELYKLVKPEAVRFVASASSKKWLLHKVAEIGQTAYGIDHNQAIDALLDRENLGPTGVGNGVALPHARLPGLDHVCGVFVRLEKPVEFAAVDHLPVDVIFALFAPENAGVEHLKALASVSRLLRNGDICAKLRSNNDPATLYTILTAEQRTQAA